MAVEAIEREPSNSGRERECGEVFFADGDATAAELRARRFVVARVERERVASSPLRNAIDDAVEAALAARGALPPAVGLDAPIESACADQIFRARALGAAGLAVIFPAFGAGDIDGGDGHTLLAWIATVRAAAVTLAFAEGDRRTLVLAPIPIEDLVPKRQISRVSIEIETSLSSNPEETTITTAR